MTTYLEVAGVEIIEHSQLIEQFLRSDKKMGEKMMALNFARKDNEFLIKGVVPNRFLKSLGEWKHAAIPQLQFNRTPLKPMC
ncbi:MAG: hypothetical protein QG574_4216 [Cyanobacteriota bacterium erpe_2018_sw_21hr_WHONDRS-SW48-000092_B_bin.40]|nr:hypothetical protein [Cyanobacteriota bacterium erpe_2018_sw_21hr_WHONDRS-SW48-000092_B_bin.40]